MGGTMTGARFGDRFVAFAACAALGLTALVPVVASASGSGAVSSGPKQLSAHQSIRPGDWVAFGYTLSVGGQHPAATFHLQNGVAKFPYSCQQNWSSTSTSISVTFPAGSIAIPANDNHWYPTDHADAAASYELSMQAPNLCGGSPIWLGSNDQNGVLYTATLTSTDTTDQVQVQFHGVDANSLANNNIDCSNPNANPSGGGMCNGAWSPHVTTTAAQYTPPPPPPSQPPSSPPPSSSGSSTPPPSSSSSPSGGGTSSSTPPSSGGTSTSGSGSTSGTGSSSGSTSSTSGTGSSTGSSSTGSSGTTSGGHAGSPTPGGMVVIRGTSSPSGVLGVTTHQPAGATTAGHAPASGPAPAAGQASGAGRASGASSAPAPQSAAQAIANTILGPVPVVIPGIAAAIGRAGGALPWNWFLALALVDGFLMALIVVRRRRAAHPA